MQDNLILISYYPTEFHIYGTLLTSKSFLVFFIFTHSVFCHKQLIFLLGYQVVFVFVF